MSDDRFDDLDDDLDTEDADETDRAPEWAKRLRRDYEKAQKELRALRADKDRLERRDLFRAAGIDPDDPKAKWFVKGYDGPLDVEAIQAEAKDTGVLAEKPAVATDEIAEHEKIQQLAAGAETPESQNRQQAYEQEMAAAQTRDEILAVMDKYGSPRSETFV